MLEKFAFYSKTSELHETEQYIQFAVIALNASCIERSYGKLCFPEEVLAKKAKSLIGKPVLLDHKWEVEKVVGVVSSAEYHDGKIIATIRIPKTLKHLVELIKLEPSPVQSVSAGILILKQEKTEDEIVVKDFEFKELSLVLEGADPNAKRLSQDCHLTVAEEKLSTAEWWDDPELRKKAPRDYFLDPSSRRYPYKTWDGKISCERLKAAMSLASLHGHKQIYERAKALYEKHCK